MASRDDRKIVSAVRVPATEDSPRRTFKDGDEDELAKAVGKEGLQRLFEQGAITGEGWGVKAAEEPKAATKSAKK